MQSTKSGGQETSPALLIHDARTNQRYRIDTSGDYIHADALSHIKGPSGESLYIYDEGSRSTACTKSAVSHLDAKTGSLQYRELTIEDIWTNHDFAELVHLLVFGSLPTPTQRKALDAQLLISLKEHLQVAPHILCFRRDAPFMTMIFSGISACAALNPSLIPVHEDKEIYGNGEDLTQHIIRTIGALAAVICVSYCYKEGRDIVQSPTDSTFIGNLLVMMGFGSGPNRDLVNDTQRRRLEALLFLHAEHGTCNATTAFMHTASTRADPLSCLLSGLASIYGPMHGGSNMVSYHQLQRIGTHEEVPNIIANVKARKQRLYGFGHRIYRVIDPRATLLRQFLDDCAAQGVALSPLYKVAKDLEHVVNTDPFFTSRNLKANTDLYTVLAYEASGIPEELVFPFICLSRTVGFLAHWREMMAERPTPWRPRQVYTGTPASPRSKL